MDIHKVACVGAGLIGQGWATLFSSAGLEVILQDVTETVSGKGDERCKVKPYVSGGEQPSQAR